MNPIDIDRALDALERLECVAMREQPEKPKIYRYKCRICKKTFRRDEQLPEENRICIWCEQERDAGVPA